MREGGRLEWRQNTSKRAGERKRRGGPGREKGGGKEMVKKGRVRNGRGEEKGVEGRGGEGRAVGGEEAKTYLNTSKNTICWAFLGMANILEKGTEVIFLYYMAFSLREDYNKVLLRD